MPAQYFIPTESPFKDLELPSGGKVQVRMLGMEDIAELGIIDQLDGLGATVQTEHIQRVKGTKKPSDRQPKKPTKAELEKQNNDAFMQVFQDKSKFKALAGTMDKVLTAAVVQPRVALPPSDPEAKREDGVVYTDQVSLVDKMHIFGHVLPSGDAMKPFREGRGEAVGDVADQPEAADSTE